MGQGHEEHPLSVYATLVMREDIYEVNMVDSRNDDTEIMYRGTHEQCHLYMKAYKQAVLAHTDYRIVKADLKLDNSFLHFQSILISQYDFTLSVEKYEPQGD